MTPFTIVNNSSIALSRGLNATLTIALASSYSEKVTGVTFYCQDIGIIREFSPLDNGHWQLDMTYDETEAMTKGIYFYTLIVTYSDGTSSDSYQGKIAVSDNALNDIEDDGSVNIAIIFPTIPNITEKDDGPTYDEFDYLTTTYDW